MICGISLIAPSELNHKPNQLCTELNHKKKTERGIKQKWANFNQTNTKFHSFNLHLSAKCPDIFAVAFVES